MHGGGHGLRMDLRRTSGRERHCRRRQKPGQYACLVLFVIVAVECRRMRQAFVLVTGKEASEKHRVRRSRVGHAARAACACGDVQRQGVPQRDARITSDRIGD